ncbi:MAG: YiiD C-terminal domain-containing protein [Nitrospirota bacterium]|nr:YiiD C-terminal domain-containing protein [Nitrospirota bacterium]
MDRCQLEQYLHEQIPLSKAIGIEVMVADDSGVTLHTPLAPNRIHRDTVFRGSTSAVAILAAWVLLYVRLQQEHVSYRMIVAFLACSTIQDSLAW